MRKKVLVPVCCLLFCMTGRGGSGTGDVYEYLIITSEPLKPAFQLLAHYRTAVNGVNSRIITIPEITEVYSGRDTQEKIRACIQDSVAQHGTLYVLLGGDGTHVPARSMRVWAEPWEATPADLYYAGLDGTWDIDGNNQFGQPSLQEYDLTADVFLGRLSLRTEAEVRAYTQKLIAYETQPSVGLEKKVMMMGMKLGDRYTGTDRPDDLMNDGHLQFQDASHPIVSDAEMWLRRLHRDFIQSRGWQADELGIMTDTLTSWDTAQGGDYVMSPSNLVTRLSEGWNFVFHISHGDWYAIEAEEELFKNTDIATLTGLTPIMYTLGCATSKWDYGNSFSDYTLRNPNGGALAYISHARSGSYRPDPAPASNTSTGEIEIMEAFLNAVFRDGDATIGEAFTNHKTALIPMVEAGSYTTLWDMYGFSLLGDPLMPVRTEATVPLAASHPASVNEDQAFTVQVTRGGSPVDGADVRIFNGFEWFQAGTDSNGDAAFTLSGVSSAQMSVVATAPNSFTYRGTLRVGSPADPVEIVTNTGSVSVPENGTVPFQVRLSAPPDGTIDVICLHSEGDRDLRAAAGEVLTFTTANWNSWQTVTLSAAVDADILNGTATFALSGTGLDPVVVSATEADRDTTLTVQAGSGGDVSPGGALVVTGGVATDISAAHIPDGGYKFSHWSVIDGSATFSDATLSSTTVIVTAPATVRANFVLNELPVIETGTEWAVNLNDSSPWSPRDLAAALWLDAADSATLWADTAAGTMAAADGEVAYWEDKSGNGKHATQSDSGARPLNGGGINGVNGLSFDGTSDHLALPPLGLDDGAFVVYVARPVDELTFAVLGAMNQHDVYNAGNTYARVFRDTRLNNVAAGFPVNTAYMGAYAASAADSLYRVYNNGEPQVNSNGTFSFDDNLEFINSSQSGTAKLAGVIGEVLVLDEIPGDEERRFVEGYLAHKWGLAGNLPAGHPYLGTAPRIFVATATLDGSVNDPDGDSVSTTWSVVSAPASVSVADPHALDTAVEFRGPGTYVLRLTADDGYGSISRDVTVTVDEVIPEEYEVVFDLGTRGSRAGGGELTQTVVQGAAAAAPEVTTEPGWRFTGWDVSFDVVTGPLTVTALYAENLPPVVSAGADQSVTLGLPWTPEQLGTALWLDAADGSTLWADTAADTPADAGGKVARWEDKSGNGKHATQSDSGARPLNGGSLNGVNGLLFDGETENMPIPLLGLDDGAFLIYVVRPVDEYTFAVVGTPNQHDVYNGNKTYARVFRSARLDNLTAGFPVNAAYMGAYEADAAASKYNVYNNGQQMVQSTAAFSFSDNMTHINSSQSGTAKMTGVMGELIVLDEAPPEAVRRQLEGYLAHKWGLAAELPSGHPHEVTEPGGEGVTVNLTASVSDPNGDSVTSQWTRVSGPDSASIGDDSAAETTVLLPEEGVYVFRLTARDGEETVYDEVTVTVSAPFVDEDEDGMDDTWEAYFFEGMDRDGSGDFDGDGFSELHEFLAGTDPTDAESALKAEAPAPAGDTEMVLSWKGVVGKTYGVYACDDLMRADWTPVATGIPGVSPVTSVNLPLSEENRFYRIRLE